MNNVCAKLYNILQMLLTYIILYVYKIVNGNPNITF